MIGFSGWSLEIAVFEIQYSPRLVISISARAAMNSSIASSSSVSIGATKGAVAGVRLAFSS
ncbi:hypothetical protein ACFSKM_07790 [Ancylobacter dichloromethanicus]